MENVENLVSENDNKALILEQLFAELNEYESEIAALQETVEDQLLKIQAHAGKTFEYQGQWYQVFTRKTKHPETKEVLHSVTSLKHLPCAPAEWLKGRPRKKAATPADVAQAATEAARFADIPVPGMSVVASDIVTELAEVDAIAEQSNLTSTEPVAEIVLD